MNSCSPIGDDLREGSEPETIFFSVDEMQTADDSSVAATAAAAAAAARLFHAQQVLTKWLPTYSSYNYATL